MIRILIAGVLGGIAMYVWTSVAHIATPLGNTGLQVMQNEAPVTAAMTASLGDRAGLYIFPGAQMDGQPVGAGPSGILAYTPGKMEMTPQTLISEAVLEIVEAVIAAFLLSLTVLVGYLSRVGFVTALGLLGALSTNPSYFIWYKFPADYVAANMFMDIVGFLVAGLVIAAILKPRVATAA